jgi:murein L,D-transpeptidase YcbB/YkuD
VIRQRPGPDNALGKVKFLFPNSYNIYLHDKPAKSFLSEQNRAFSHGCIRVGSPYLLTKYLLSNDSTWKDAFEMTFMVMINETRYIYLQIECCMARLLISQ